MDHKDCNTELSLRLCTNSDSSGSSKVEGWLQEAKLNRKNNQQKKMIIFYNGKKCICEVTEPQARAIISLAFKHKQNGGTSFYCCEHEMTNRQLMNSGLAKKRSLQQFLQKRKRRMDEISPYARRTETTMRK